MSNQTTPNTPAKTTGAEGRITGVRKSSEILAQHLGMDPQQMIAVIKAQCFKGSRPGDITNEQLAAYINVARSLQEQAPRFNPLLPGMLYAFPSKNGGIEPMIGPDGIFAILGSCPDVTIWRMRSETDEKGNLIAAVAEIDVKGRGTFEKRVWLKEWKVGTNPNWNTRPSHMLEIRALKQCARMVIHGVPLDEEEIQIREWQEVTESAVEAQHTAPGTSRTEQLARLIAPVVAEDRAPDPEPEPEIEPEQEEPTPPDGLAPEPSDMVPTDGAAAYNSGFPEDSCPHERGASRTKWVNAWQQAERESAQ